MPSQEVPVHAAKHSTASCRPQGQDPRYSKDVRDCAVPQVTERRCGALETTFELNDTLYAKAEVPPTDEVYLWLGANVMLAYPIPEAEELLQSKLSTAKQSLSTCEEDLDFLREQITVCILHAVG